MKLCFILFIILTLVSPCSAQVDVEGEVSGEWDADDNPFVIVGDATVPDGELLTIGPGVQIIFREDVTLTVNGNIIAIGTIGSAVDTIRFHGPEGAVSGTLILKDRKSV